jgi:DNA-directed RNA polymerase subunit F
MIKNTTPLNMTETLEYVKKDSDGEVEVKKFIKKFIKLKPEKAKEIRKKLEGLDLMKMKPEHIVKIIDLLPEDSENLNKIFNDVSLNEDETKKILETIEEFR